MIKAGAIDKGMCLLHKDSPYLVTEREFVNPGKGSAFVRLKLKNLKTGLVLKETMKTQDNVEEISVEDIPSQYLYADEESYHFMDNESYEQFEVKREGMEDKILFMREGDTYKITKWENRPIDILIPAKMVYEVTESEEAVRGDTVTGATKTVTLETGLTIKVPIFIKQHEKIMINTESREYVERVNS
ncbi:MAG: elongation factor P [Spirochaetales bacterium]|jgi:elongation factor P|nr:elongation factor P [Spirochaetales bacterium]